MALLFEQMLTEDLGDASYLVGDDSAHVAAVVDPMADVDRYLDAARRRKVVITHVFQTHIHEDHVSGAYALAQEAGNAELCLGADDAPAYGFAHRAVRDSDTFCFGDVTLTARHTPGHTPEHFSLLVAKSSSSDQPFAVLSGGSLLVDAAGRTDLLGPERADELTRAQYRTLHDFFLALPDGVIVWPTHVHGSPCGAAIGDRLQTTVGHERHHNPLLQLKDEQAFHAHLLGALPPKPSYYARLKEINSSMPRADARLPRAPALTPDSFEKAARSQGTTVVDTRHLLAFGGGHIPGALNLGAAGPLSIWAGWMLDPERSILLVLDRDSTLPDVLRQFVRTGFDRFAGYLAGGMTAWENSGKPLQTLPQLAVDDLAQQSAQYRVIDVRAPGEWRKGHIPGAEHSFLPQLPERLRNWDPGAPVAVYCDSGYRASIGASLLQRAGFEQVRNVPGSWQAWTARHLPVDGDS